MVVDHFGPNPTPLRLGPSEEARNELRRRLQLEPLGCDVPKESKHLHERDLGVFRLSFETLTAEVL